jgi:hypothetical protein
MKKMDLTFKEPLLNVNQNPNADNTSTSLASYYQKKLYEIKSFQHPYISDNKPLNFLYEKQFYGRVNLAHDSVISDSVRLKTIPTPTGVEITLHNFVMDAYKEFILYWDSLKKVNLIAPGGFLQSVSAKISYIDPGKKYFYYMSSMFERFKNKIKTEKIKIKNFDDFADEFVLFVDETTPSIPILFSSYIRSRMADPLISGLCFDVNTFDPSNDEFKYSSFLQDPNFAIFKNVAMKFGFFVDKQVPWRLWADIDSPAMKPYMDVYNITQDNLYDLNFISADSYDLELLRFYIIQFYNTHVFSNKTIIEPEFKVCSKTGNISIINKVFKLNELNREQVISDINFDRFFMKLYVFIKARENNYKWDKTKFEHIVTTFIQIKEGLDTKAAMRYIAPLVKLPAAYEQAQRSFQFR